MHGGRKAREGIVPFKLYLLKVLAAQVGNEVVKPGGGVRVQTGQRDPSDIAASH